MKVKLLIARGGPNISQKRGDIVDVSDDEGRRLIESGQAVAIKSRAEKATKDNSKVEQRDQ